MRGEVRCGADDATATASADFHDMTLAEVPGPYTVDASLYLVNNLVYYLDAQSEEMKCQFIV